MKSALWVLVVLCVISVLAQEKNGEKNTGRVVKTPSHFYTAESFLEMPEVNRIFYTAGLMDGFFASTLFGATDATVANLSSCTEGMDANQVSAIITKYVKDHPEFWHHPLSIEAHNALNATCRGALKVVN